MIWPSISGLAKNAALKAIKSDLENKIPNISSLVKKKNKKNKKFKKKKKKTDYSTKIISETEKKVADHKHDKYIITPEFNKIKTKDFSARLKQADLVTMMILIIN